MIFEITVILLLLYIIAALSQIYKALAKIYNEGIIIRK